MRNLHKTNLDFQHIPADSIRWTFRFGLVSTTFLLLFATYLGAAPTCSLSGSGTTGDPYQIATYGDLDSLGANCDLTATYRLVADIDASASDTENSGSGFQPIGSNATPFSGVFHGSGHTVFHLHIADSTDTAVGLFGIVDSATIDSLGLDSSNVAAWVGGQNVDVGSVVGLNAGGSIQDCHVSNDTVTGILDSVSVGGIVGDNQGSIVGATSNAIVSGARNAEVGGVAGANTDTIRSSRSYGLVSGNSGANIGGVAGYSEGVLAMDSSFAVVGGTGEWLYAGGIVGWSNGAGGIDTDYFAGNVSGDGTNSELGGIVGRLESSLLGGVSHAVVSGSGDSSRLGGLVGKVDFGGGVFSSWSTGAVTGSTNSAVGGLVGINDLGGIVSTSFATGTVVGNSNSNVGGAMGQNNGFASHIYATGRAQGFGNGTNVGGLVGMNSSDSIIESYATGRVRGTALAGGDNLHIGGACGFNGAKLRQVYAVGEVSSTGPSTNIFTGGVAGFSDDSVIDAYWNTQTSGQTGGFGIGSTNSSSDSATGLTTRQMVDSNSFANFVFGTDSTWKITQNKTFPALNGQVNAPFALPDSLLVDSTGLVLARLLANDADADTATPSFVAVLDSVFKGNLASFAASTAGTLDTLLYRVGEVTSTGDTLWGGEARAALELVSFHFDLGDDTAYPYGGASFSASSTVSPSFPVTYTSQDSTVASISGNQVQPLKLGTTILSATIGDLTRTASLRVPTKFLSITGAVAQDKVYDGTVAATVAEATLSGVVPGDTVKLTVTSATFDTKDTGTAKTVTVTGATLSGSGAGNYVLAAAPSLTANITAKTLMIAAKADTIPLNGTASLTYTDTGLVSPDAITGALQSSNSGTGTSGTYQITQGTLSAGSNYAIVFTGANLVIKSGTDALAGAPILQFNPSHELATNIGQAFAPPAIGSGRAELGTGVAGGENAQTVDILLTGPGSVSVAIYDNLGTLVISFTRDIAWMDLNELTATEDGRWILPLSWNLRAQNGVAVPTGVYLWKIDIQTLDGKKLDTVKRLGVRENR